MPSPSASSRHIRRWSPSIDALSERAGVRDAIRRARRVVRTLAFWIAAVLPAVYLPLLLAGAVEPAVTLLPAHAAALVAGHRHGRPD